MMKVTKFKVLLYLKKGSTDKRGKAVKWLQVAVDGYCPIGLVAVSLHPQKALKPMAWTKGRLQ